MRDSEVTINELYLAAEEYFPHGLMRVELWDIGVKFIWVDRQNDNQERSAFLQTSLKALSLSQARGFLEAETQEDQVSK